MSALVADQVEVPGIEVQTVDHAVNGQLGETDRVVHELREVNPISGAELYLVPVDGQRPPFVFHPPTLPNMESAA